MNNNYKRTFDAVHLSQARQEELRAELSSRLLEEDKEGYSMRAKWYHSKKSCILVIAAVLVLSFVFMGFAFGSQIIPLLGGGRIEQGRSNGYDYSSITMVFESDLVEVVDGEIFFILDGSNENITNQCSDETYYEYEKTSEDGYRHVVVIGGTPDNIGMAEFVWDQNGNHIGSTATYNTDQDEKPLWLESAEAKLLQD